MLEHTADVLAASSSTKASLPRAEKRKDRRADDVRDGRAPARLEFRESPDRRSVLAAIFNYRPSLHWWIYRLTQAPIHLLVMKFFGWHLARQQPGARHSPEGRPVGEA